jgi:hypothetical protein
MADSKTPAGVNPALWSEFQRLSDKVHELHRQRELEETTPTSPQSGSAPTNASCRTPSAAIFGGG